MEIQEILNFLKELSNNNNREWFNSNKEKYLDAKQKFEILIDLLIHGVRKFDKGIGGLQAKDCTFRIYRDVRFSKDKSPYKTQMGGFIVPDGKKSGKAGYYFHIEPANSFVAGGMHLPPSEILRSVRNYIFEYSDEFKSILHDSKFITHFGEINGEKLKSAPKGFPKEFPDIELLKFKSYTVVKELSAEDLNSNDIIDNVTKIFQVMSPFILFLNKSFKS